MENVTELNMFYRVLLKNNDEQQSTGPWML